LPDGGLNISAWDKSSFVNSNRVVDLEDIASLGLQSFDSGSFETTMREKWDRLVVESNKLDDHLRDLKHSHGWQFTNASRHYEEGGLWEWPEALFIILRATGMVKPQTVCEIGFNTGHSALMWLIGGAETVVSFDICRHPYTMRAAEKLNTQYPGRIHLIPGNSTETVPRYAQSPKAARCDVVFVDGDHNWDMPLVDLKQLQQLSHEKTLVIMDDTECNEGWCTYPRNGWFEMKSLNRIVETQCISKVSNERGLCFGRYLF